MPQRQSRSEQELRELQAILDEEVGRLPPKYRDPFVLCCLAGKSRTETAQELGWKEGTVASRVAQARKLLQRRLAQRGVALTAAFTATALSASAAVPARLVKATIRGVLTSKAGTTWGTQASAGHPAVPLAGAAKPMSSSKWTVVMSLVVVSLVASAGVLMHRVVSAPADRETAEQSKGGVAQTIKVRGRVLGPDGKPFAGAKLYLGHYQPGDKAVVSLRATSGKDGRFEVTYRRAELSKARPDRPVGRVKMFTFYFSDQHAAVQAARVGQLAAVAAGLGCDWVRVDKVALGEELTLRLVKDVPVNGRIIDKDGRPLAGAKLCVWFVGAYPGENLNTLVTMARKHNELVPGAKHWFGPLPGQPEVLTAGADGRFRVSGFGGERLVGFEVVGGRAIGRTSFRVMTRVGETVVGPGKPKGEPGAGKFPKAGVPAFPTAPLKLYAATFRYLAEASRPIRGVLRDKETGKPMAGVQMWVERARGGEIPAPGTTPILVAARTDKEGRYEFLGFPKSEVYIVCARPETGRHFTVSIRVKDTPGLEPLTVDVQVPRGLVLRGRVTDKRTGKPIPGARVHYIPLYRNTETDRLTDYFRFEAAATAGPDGSFAVAGLPGLGVLATVAPAAEAYERARVTHKELVAFCKKFKAPVQTFISPRDLLGDDKGRPFLFRPGDFHALALIHPKKKDKELTQDLVLRPDSE